VTRERATRILSAVLVALGLVILVQTAVRGGGIGYLLGVLMIGAGALRIWLLRRGG
jgi:hypothetical protein